MGGLKVAYAVGVAAAAGMCLLAGANRWCDLRKYHAGAAHAGDGVVEVARKPER
jgi:hypothetical protein